METNIMYEGLEFTIQYDRVLYAFILITKDYKNGF